MAVLGQWVFGAEHGALTQEEMVVTEAAEAAAGTVVLVAVMLLLTTVVPAAAVQVKLQVIQLIPYQMFQVKFHHKMAIQEHPLKQAVHITEVAQVMAEVPLTMVNTAEL